MVTVGADVYSKDGKKIGKVKSVNDDEILVFDKGLLADEEYHIPANLMSGEQPIRLKLTEEQLKHGREYLAGKPNSDFMHGKLESEPKVSMEKQVIRYEPQVSAEPEKYHNPPPVTGKHQSVFAQSGDPEYLYKCDMCMHGFDDPEDLNNHRASAHKMPTNI